MTIVSSEIDEARQIITESEGSFMPTKDSEGGTELMFLQLMKETFKDLFLLALVKDEGKIAGYISAWPLKNTLAIGPLYVSPDFRGQGIADIMVKYIIDQAIKSPQNYEAVRTQTWSGNPAMLKIFYRLGFVDRKIIPGDRIDGSDTVQLIYNF